MKRHRKPDPGPTAQREARVRGEPHARIILLRHGEPDWAPEDGPSVTDPGLTPYGQAQAHAAASRIAKDRIDALYVSPYRRARETAAPIAEATGLEPVVVEGLAEIEVAVEGLDQEQVDRYFVDGSQRPLPQHWDGWPGAETFRHFYERVTAAMSDVLARHGMHSRREPDGEFAVWRMDDEPPHLVIVAHGGTNSVALTHLLDVRPVPWEWLRFESELCTYSVLQARPLGPEGYVWSLQDFGEFDHLVEAGLRSR